jgi:hypothetical protein
MRAKMSLPVERAARTTEISDTTEIKERIPGD